MGAGDSKGKPNKQASGSGKAKGRPTGGAASQVRVAPRHLPLFEYREDAWHPAAMAEETAEWPDEFRMVTFNVWFDVMDYQARWQHVLDEALASSPHVVCFQEAIPAFVAQVADHPSVRAGYYMSEIPGNLFCTHERRYGEMLLMSKVLGPPACVAFEPFEASIMGRRLLHARWNHPRAIHTGSVHLESLDNAASRGLQLAAVHRVQASSEHALVAGDFNFCAYRNFRDPQEPLENDALVERLPEYVDVWAAVHPDSRPDSDFPGFTFDSTVNKNIRIGAGDAPGQAAAAEVWRIDRIMLRSKNWSPAAIRILGTRPFLAEDGREVWPSDHFGLAATFSWTDTQNFEEDKA